MLSKVVKDKDGNERTVMADSQKELDAVAKEVANREKATYPNINVPVAKGHDLVSVDEDLNVTLVDGTGAHNSPNNAVDPFNPKTDPEVMAPGLDEPALKSVGDPGNVRPATDKEAEANVKANS